MMPAWRRARAVAGRALLPVADILWAAGTALVLVAILAAIVTSLRRGEFGLDVIAALAMAGALVLGEHLAGIIVALMFTGGQALEERAQRRARREMTALLSRVPRRAARYRAGQIEEVDLPAIALGFLAVTLAFAGAAWMLSGDPVRALAVLVVATPCPLILAVPVAIVSGVSRAARSGVLVKGGAALERLAAVQVVLVSCS